MNMYIKSFPSPPRQISLFTLTYAYFLTQALSMTKPFKSFPAFTTRMQPLISIYTLFPEKDSTHPCKIPKMTIYLHHLFFIFQPTIHLWQNSSFTLLQVYFLKSHWCGSLSINLSVPSTSKPTLHQPELFVCATTLLWDCTSHMLHNLPLQKVC